MSLKLSEPEIENNSASLPLFLAYPLIPLRQKMAEVFGTCDNDSSLSEHGDGTLLGNWKYLSRPPPFLGD
jgi:hypothetical protein